MACVSDGANRWTAATWADLQDCNTSAANGDTVTLAAGNIAVTSTVDITKALIIRGAGSCTLDGNGCPISCPTVLQVTLAEPNCPLTWTWVEGDARHRLTNFKIQNMNAADYHQNGYVQIRSMNTNGTKFRVDHIIWDNLPGHHMLDLQTVVGLYDHNTCNLISAYGSFCMYLYNLYWNTGSYSAGDESWAAGADWGGASNWFVEDNTMTSNVVTGGHCLDSDGGTRIVWRFNRQNCGMSYHGTESAGRRRGAFTIEVYANDADMDGTQAYLTNMRSGTGLFWGNKTANITEAYAPALNNQRNADNFLPWESATGDNPVDNNDPGNPINAPGCISGTCTAASGGSQTVTIAGTPWTAHVYQGYIIKKLNCVPGAGAACSAIILDNTTNTITTSGPIHSTSLAFTAGDTFEINILTEALDQPGRSGGTLGYTATGCNATSSGTAATMTCSGGHHIANGDWVVISDGNATNYSGVYQATVSGGSTTVFTYTCHSTCGGADSGWNISKIPWTAGQNDQIDEPIYQWMNYDSTLGILGTKLYEDSTVAAIRLNEHYYNGGAIQTTAGPPGSPFTGATGVGWGTLDNRPSDCTTGVFYFATDQGSWNTSGRTYSVNGISYSQGLGYTCTSLNTWTQDYTPYQYPHPLNISDAAAAATAVITPVLSTF